MGGTLIKFLVLVLVLFFVLNSIHYEVEGGESISEEEDMEIERQLKILNKTPIKTFHSEFGDVIDCIDIYKQPALDHPALKNHKILLRPDNPPTRHTTEKTSSIIDEPKTSGIRPDGIECPKGTVPIRRTTKEDLIRAKSLTKARNGSNASNYYGEHGAILKLDNGYQQFYGINADISTYQPTVYEDEFSTAHMWVVGNAKDEQLNNIQVGLAVHPTLFGDHRLRMFTYWTADGSYKTGCYNFLCHGYVQIHQYFGPGSKPSRISTYDGGHYVNRFFIYQDRKQKVWWLVFTGDTHVGYWPNSIFSGSLSKGFANGLYWGGITKAGSHVGINPAMGSGHYPDGVYGHSGFFHWVQYVNGFNQIIDLKDTPMDAFVDCQWYNITNLGYTSNGNAIYFGGPGGRCPTLSNPAAKMKMQS
ncbi:hypothetical protein MKW98_012974 [Papaver atlanticum]|uniref:Neprosin PEP catalytic domain-containing protein n=1 Tax=Papaver atlanticum TaxID=357466 RepID=A0AAD4SLL4_9MAGN|nr:hypothetical protein MKW98_012974 [Papaver atlanticum]